ncbi:hypothetical protein D3C86_1825640 [compost metagenome]
MAQQVPVQGREKGALEQGFMLNLLDQQVGLHFRDMRQDVLPQVVGPCHLDRHLQSPCTQIVGLRLEPVAVILQVGLTRRFPVTLFKKGQKVQWPYQPCDMQTGAAGLGQRGCMIDCRGMTQGRVDDQ